MEFKNLTLLQAKRYGLFICRAEDALGSVVHEMAQRDVSALVVVDGEGLLEGIITRTDLLRSAALNPDWSGQRVSSAMTVDVVTIGLHETLGAVMKLLLQEHIHRVVAVESEGARKRPLALLSTADIIFHMDRAANFA